MRLTLAACTKSLTLGIALTAMLIFSQGTARADAVTIIGVTAGCFNCGPSGPFFVQGNFLPTVLPGLAYSASSINLMTNSLGDASFGNTVGPLVDPNNPFSLALNQNNLGSFYLSGAPGSYGGNTFRLQLSLVVPTQATMQFVANVSGLVEQTDQGNLRIDFDNDFQTFSFVDANNGSRYTFQVRVNDVSITPGHAVALTGDFHNATVPEPATVLLLGTGLAGLAGAARRRMKRGTN